MKEYIERKWLIHKVYQNPAVEANERCAQLLDAILEAPSADVAPVVHGEWIHKNGEMYCSACGSEALMDEVYYKSPYCPECGAIMDGGNKS
jgi:hypothetical protein